MEEKGRAGTRQDEITELSLFLFSSRLSCHVVEAAWCRDSGLVFHDGRRMYMHGMDKGREGLERARGREGVFVFAVSRMLQMWVGRVLFDLVGLMNRFAGLAAMGLSFFKGGRCCYCWGKLCGRAWYCVFEIFQRKFAL